MTAASRKSNPGQASQADECWAVENWCKNTVRTDTKITDKPWAALLKKCPTLYSNVPEKDPTTRVKIKDEDKWKYVTVNDLSGICGVITPAGCVGGARAATVFASGSDYHRCVIVAQLNLKFSLAKNEIQWCTKDASGIPQLPLMAQKGNEYRPTGGYAAWNTDKIATYLKSNYIAALTP